jgi:hypothetical protein
LVAQAHYAAICDKQIPWKQQIDNLQALGKIQAASGAVMQRKQI